MEPIKKLVELINEFSKVTEYMINMQKSILSLIYELQTIGNVIPFTIGLKM